MSVTQWNFGDRVVHAGKPEWGVGQVTGASRMVHEGKVCQRLTVRFDRAGVKTLNTAIADLRPASEAAPGGDETPAPGASESGGNGGWLEQVSAPTSIEVFTRLPEQTTDPFTSLASRVKASAGLYRFTDTGASLLDWAAMQSGLRDPLTRYSRHELEQLFRRFAAVRDEHFKKVASELKRRDPGGFDEAMKGAPPAALQAVKRLDVGR
jgi:hypothetical protein